MPTVHESLSRTQYKADESTVQAYGVPVAGESASISFDATDKTTTLDAWSMYWLCATEACFVGAADTTVAANRVYLPANVPTAMKTGPSAFTLHATQVTGPGTLYIGKIQEAP